jgi:hypothetical protein
MQFYILKFINSVAVFWLNMNSSNEDVMLLSVGKFWSA